ncbi:shikimate dehydrogenase [Roseomonas sp. OT10]|uniref:shikimate dehydrogenase family protein n=1 Tax=Roseomonas cutis TaxID=2897332 RepID=UPI001E32FE07|nr:shikimate dehydrogenase [Roseomonas sp. OT10]UFN47683.1 shikimate dehydrogenase [Roseomonas sp. OT10]
MAELPAAPAGAIRLDGATRLHVIIGDPIAQVKSPDGVSRALAARGLNAVLVPIQVPPDAVAGFVRGASLARNLDGIIVTVPHKFAAASLCDTLTDRARFLGAVNVMRRNPDGGWHGDMTDGEGHVASLRAGGCEPAGRRALLVGSGGAGTAIALALHEAGVAELAIHDADAARRDQLIDRLAGRGGAPVVAGSDDPAGYELVVNATPAGMRPGDPLPVRTERLSPDAFVSDVVTVPEVTPLLAAARARGCGTRTGTGMFEAVRDRMVAFLLAD